ncbi:hypothetical protein DYB37_001802 [Aphanomyces astaci]|uniref:START domain-containing protein n=1 Tax=Aphanomyces astaci TaxID=112090 RepID=A0A3L6VIU0_APHAT|nr:hypothetical protein DYB35_000136 [Aphanomyces astaci]RHZ16050.1 hypothetical protein DYB37_001802 [Aphanomyces astaci]RLO08559.1 hypothetical protein DYB28_002943 [Aphanomyces astaci]
MTGHGVFRGDAYRWLLVQLELKVSVAQDCIHSYVGHSQRLDLRGHPHLFIAADYVDFVCSRSVPALLDCVGHATWNMLTDVPTHAVRTTKVLDTAGKDICYVQVRIENGHRRNVPVVVNVLYKRTVAPHQVIVVFRTIHEDDLFPMPTQPLHIGLSGWYE